MFTIDGVFATNPLTGQTTSHLQYFVVTCDVIGGGVPTEDIYPFGPPIHASRIN